MQENIIVSSLHFYWRPSGDLFPLQTSSRKLDYCDTGTAAPSTGHLVLWHLKTIFQHRFFPWVKKENDNNNKGPNNCPDLKCTRGVWFQFWDGMMDAEASACAGWGPRVYTVGHHREVRPEGDQNVLIGFWQLCRLQLRELLTKTFSDLCVQKID